MGDYSRKWACRHLSEEAGLHEYNFMNDGSNFLVGII
jgi:hypothetical protein